MENPVFYVQYAHARIHSIGREVGASAASTRGPLADGRPRRCSSTSGSSTCCARSSELPEVVGLAAADRAPHKVTTWVRELAGRVPRLLPRLLRDR